MPVEEKHPCLPMERMILEQISVFCHVGAVSAFAKPHLHLAHVMKNSITMDLDYTNTKMMVVNVYYSPKYQIRYAIYCTTCFKIFC